MQGLNAVREWGGVIFADVVCVVEECLVVTGKEKRVDNNEKTERQKNPPEVPES